VVAKAYGDKLYDNLNFTLPKLELLELLALTVLVNHYFQNDNGRRKPDAGEFVVDTVKSTLIKRI
jgi:hypothetical protein